MNGVDFQLLVEALSDPLLVCDEDLLVVYTNPAATALVGGDPEWFEDNPADTWIQGPDGLLFPPQGETRELEVEMCPPRGGSQRVRARVGPLPVRGAMGWYIQIRGPSAAAERLVGMQVVAGAIAGQLSQHLRTVITCASEGLMAGLGEEDAERHRRVLAAGEHAAQLQRQLLALDMRDGEQRGSLSLASLVLDFSHSLREELGGVGLEVQAEEGEGPLVGDPAALQLLLSLLARFTAGLTPPCEAVQLTVRERAGRVRLTWALQGCPLTPALRERLLEPRDATPFGLSVAWAILRSHEGRLVLDGEAEGVWLHIDLPGLETARERHREAQGGTETVLLVEDEPGTREWMEESLCSLGYAVIAVDNGVTASVILRERHAEIDIVLTDAVLPGRSGPELIAEARRLKPSPKVLLMSGYSSDFLGDQLQAGVPLLPKPFGPSQLYAALRALLDPPE